MIDFAQYSPTLLLTSFAIIQWNVNGYISRRQIKRCAEALEDGAKVPEQVKDLVTEEEYQSSARYALDRLQFNAPRGLFELLCNIASFWYMPLAWNWLQRYIDVQNQANFFYVWYLMTSLPFSFIDTFTFGYYNDFVLEERHGFNKKTLTLFVTDYVKESALVMVLGYPMMHAFLFVASWAGDQFALYVSIFLCAAIFLFVAIVPVLIMPLFNKYEPLKNDELRAKIEAMAQDLGFPLYKLEQVDGSTRSSHSNAFFYGIGPFKRIALFDTLLHAPQDQILAILGHELGHWKMYHAKFNLVMVIGMIIAHCTAFGLIAVDNASLPTSLGYEDPSMNRLLGFMLFMEFFSPIQLCISKFMTYVSRVFEYQADRFACELGYGDHLIAALKLLTKENKAFTNPDPIYSFWHFTHPTTAERRNAITEFQASKKCEASDLKESKKTK